MTRHYEFTPTEAVASARRRAKYIRCPACHSERQRYLFHRTGVRFVKCRACGLVYADPVDPGSRTYFDIAALGQHDRPRDRDHLLNDARARFLAVADAYRARFGRSPRTILLIGRWHRSFVDCTPDGVELLLAGDSIDDETELVTKPLRESLAAVLPHADVVLLDQLLEGVHDPDTVLDGFAKSLRSDQIVCVAFANMQSLPSRVLRRRWKSFFDRKIAFYDSDNLGILLWRNGLQRVDQARLRTTYSLGYFAERLELGGTVKSALTHAGLAGASAQVASGYELEIFVPVGADDQERLSIVVPVYNEERYVRDILEALLAKELSIDKEIIIVESASTDSSRDIVREFEERSGITVVYQDQARGKGNAVREGLEHATGTFMLIQDADFEYDLDDYDGLLEPLLQRRASFVLGSRSLGLDDWKVRQYASSPFKSFLMNFAQVVFARSFNLLYQQKVTDINTMFKVFRRECIDGVHFGGNGFNFDIELVCKIVRNGYEPLEVPVNYVARGFDEGKKINFLLDAYPSYFQLFRCRYGPI
jgi:hypothetical protein